LAGLVVIVAGCYCFVRENIGSSLGRLMVSLSVCYKAEEV